jgi:hypothetical protein
MVDNRPFFDPIVPEFDKWIVAIEDINIPRNLVAHMNLPSITDVKRIDVLYMDAVTLIKIIEEKIKIRIP